jgi:hypothetical protein
MIRPALRVLVTDAALACEDTPPAPDTGPR